MSTYKEKSGKNGYEIRADILALAKSSSEHEYNAKMEQWELSAGDITDMPQIPTLSTILAVAQEMYAFVEENTKKGGQQFERYDESHNDRTDPNSAYYYRQFKKA
jgi:hypothetical protein